EPSPLSLHDPLPISAVEGLYGVVLGRLLAEVDLRGRRRRKISKLGQCCFWYGPDRVQCGPDPGRRAVGQCANALAPRRHAAVAEPLLHRIEGTVPVAVEAATEVTGVQQGDS